MGDTGTGTSSLIRQRLEQIDDGEEAAIVSDTALELTPQFYGPERRRSRPWQPGLHALDNPWAGVIRCLFTC